MQSGDRNTAYFHAVTKGRKKRNRITVIEVAEENPVHEEDDVDKVFTDYYQKLFSSKDHQDYQIVEETISRV